MEAGNETHWLTFQPYIPDTEEELEWRAIRIKQLEQEIRDQKEINLALVRENQSLRKSLQPSENDGN